MSKPDFGIVGICAAVSAVVLTVTIGIICLRLVIGPNGKEVATNSSAKTAEELERDPAIIGKRGSTGVKKDAKAKDKKGANQKQRVFLIAIDGNEFHQAKLDEDRRKKELFERADRLTGNGGQPKRLHGVASLGDLPLEEKNRIWWEIAAVAEVKKSDEIKYTLTTVKALRLAKRYKTSVLEIFTLFREGAEATWRTNEPPPEPEDEDEDEDNKE